jgi:hypothetical protein
MIEMPVSTLTMASPNDTDTPRDKLVPIALAEMAPEVISSTCFVRTNTAGSARTMKYPMIMPMGTITQA